MTYSEFRVPVDDELKAVLGVHPEPGDEVGVRNLVLGTPDGSELVLTVDALGRSTTLIVRRDGDECLRLFREGATELHVSTRPPEIVVRFRTKDSSGHIEVTLKPRLHLSESTLLG